MHTITVLHVIHVARTALVTIMLIAVAVAAQSPAIGIPIAVSVIGILVVTLIADWKGKSVLGYFLFAVLAWPIALIAVLLARSEYAPQRVVVEHDPIERLERLGRLHESGALTKAEFEQEKAKTLGEA